MLLERALLLIGLATRSSIVLPAVCSCVRWRTPDVFLLLWRGLALLTRGRIAVLPAVCAAVSACFFGPCTAWLAFLQQLMRAHCVGVRGFAALQCTMHTLFL